MQDVWISSVEGRRRKKEGKEREDWLQLGARMAWGPPPPMGWMTRRAGPAGTGRLGVCGCVQSTLGCEFLCKGPDWGQGSCLHEPVGGKCGARPAAAPTWGLPSVHCSKLPSLYRLPTRIHHRHVPRTVFHQSELGLVSPYHIGIHHTHVPRTVFRQPGLGLTVSLLKNLPRFSSVWQIE